SLLTTIAGLVSFPFLTRVFSVAEYGMMNLIAATLSLTVAVGKVGVQHSIIRYHSEIASGKRTFGLNHLYSTTFFGMLGSGLAAGLILLAVTYLGPADWFGDLPDLRLCFALTCIIVVAQVVESVLVNLVRARQLTTLLMVYQVIKRYALLGLVIAGILLVARS